VSTIQESIVTTKPNEVVLCYIGHDNNTGSIVSASNSAGLTFYKRKDNTSDALRRETFWYYWAVMPIPGSLTVYVTFSDADNSFIGLIGLAGMNTSSVFDPNASLPALATWTYPGTISPSATISTSNPNDLIIALLCDNVGGVTTIVAGSGFTLIQSASDSSKAIYGASEYVLISAVQSGLKVGFTSSSTPVPAYTAIFVDAIQAAPVTPPPPQPKATTLKLTVTEVPPP
jgi:hypothetical protein